MTIFRVLHNSNYTVINNSIATDKRISWKAKGIYLYAFSRRNDWTFHLNDLINQSIDGRESVTSGLKELEEAGYLMRDQKREKGKFCDGQWTFYEVSQNVKIKEIIPKTGKPLTVKPLTALPLTVNQPLVSTEILSTEILNTENSTSTLSLEKNEKEIIEIEKEKNFDKIEELAKKHNCKISEKSKARWRYRYPEDQILNAMAFAITRNPDSLEAYTEKLLQNKDQNLDGVSNGSDILDSFSENKRWSIEVEKNIKNLSGTFVVLNKGIEFVNDGMIGANCINYKENGFKEQVINLIRLKQIPIRKGVDLKSL